MKTIGLLGGMSWESTVSYYTMINEAVKMRLGGLHSAKILLYSVDFAEIEALQHAGDWDAAAEVLVCAAQNLERGGADCVLICTNTMHKVAPQIRASVGIPLIHIADATALALQQAGVTTVALLGTAYTMEQDFYKGRLTDQFGLKVLTPDAADRSTVHDIIYKELCLGQIRPDSKQRYTKIIAKLKQQGAEAVILGCTEIGLLIRAEDSCLPVFDTTSLHAQAAVCFALE